ncbi:hypothetical protein [Herbaspirillum autotrophicum]|uniref:hypothetical protein n=1 Tax=Herbaspirillum autotrophicum TaxID=180195 RepID=UPI00067CF663|nr:hypothetical protein [Herbaspirillum autotrophicum]
MSSIIVGRFQLQDETEHAVDQLVLAGHPRTAIATFYLNPAGQHDLYPIGGDRDKSPGASDTDVGVVAGAGAGAVVGAGAGAVLAPVTGPVGPILGTLAGAHVGALIGSLDATADSDDGTHANENQVRRAGMRVAVAIVDDEQQRRVVATLRELGAVDMEYSEGSIVDGDWTDFDPLTSPHYLDQGKRAAAPL